MIGLARRSLAAVCAAAFLFGCAVATAAFAFATADASAYVAAGLLAAFAWALWPERVLEKNMRAEHEKALRLLDARHAAKKEALNEEKEALNKEITELGRLNARHTEALRTYRGRLRRSRTETEGWERAYEEERRTVERYGRIIERERNGRIERERNDNGNDGDTRALRVPSGDPGCPRDEKPGGSDAMRRVPGCPRDEKPGGSDAMRRVRRNGSPPGGLTRIIDALVEGPPVHTIAEPRLTDAQATLKRLEPSLEPSPSNLDETSVAVVCLGPEPEPEPEGCSVEVTMDRIGRLHRIEGGREG